MRDIDINYEEEETVKPKKKKGGYTFFTIISLTSLLLGIIVILILYFGNKIILEGSKELNIYEGTTYTEPGYTATDLKGNNVNEKVSVNGKVDTSTVGTYVVSYRYGLKTVKRTINVIAKSSISTVLYLEGDKTMRLNINEEYVEPGYSAIDIKDGDLTESIKVTSNLNNTKKGTYRIVYSVVNSEGITTSDERTIIVR